MTIPNPNELHKRLKHDPDADIGQIVLGDRMCLFATLANGSHLVASDFEIGDEDNGIGLLVDALIRQETGECGGPGAVPVATIEIVHESRVLDEWRQSGVRGCWERYSIIGGIGPVVSVTSMEVEHAKIDIRAEMDKALIAAGWRLL